VGLFHGVPVRTSLYYLKDNKVVDYIPDESSIAAFRERVCVMSQKNGTEQDLYRGNRMQVLKRHPV